MSLKKARLGSLADQLEQDELDELTARQAEEAKIKASKHPSPKKLKD